MIIDTHCHFDMMDNPESYINQKEEIGDIVIGMTNLPSHFKMGSPYVSTFKHVRIALGFHPLLAMERRRELSLFKQYVDQTSYIGEIGLDFSRDGIASKDDQLIVIREVLSVLQGKNKIISVHSRGAEHELLELLTEFCIDNVVFHWYSGPIELISTIVSRGYYFSINEAMTVSKKGRAIIENIPLDRILTETDAPYNTKASIENALTNLQISEVNVRNNFKQLIARIK